MAVVILAVASASAIVSGPGAQAADNCIPSISSVSEFAAKQTQSVTIDGSCFGTGNTYSGDSAYFRITDENSGWNACYENDDPADFVTCDVTQWTNTSITFSGYTGDYGQRGWVVNDGDQVAVQVRNAQTGTGPAVCDVIAGKSGVTSCGGSGGCQQVTLPDGSYEFGGCVEEEDNGTLDVTAQQSNLDGVEVSASPSDQVTYSDGGSEGNALSSAGASTLSLDLGGTLIEVFRGRLGKPLTKPITVTVPAGTQIAGLGVSGTLTLTPGTGGHAAGKIAVTLPPVLGGGKATLTFTTTVNAGLSSVQIDVPHATFMQLFALSNVTLRYAPATGTWSVKGTATAGGGTSTPFNGSLVYSGNTLTSASLSVGKINLTGLTDISQLTVSYNSNGEWSGSATITHGTSSGPVTATVRLGFTGATLTSGSITAANLPLFGIINVAGFSMSYADGTWKLSVTTTLTGGGGGTGTLTVSGGIVTAASLTLTNMTFLNKFTVATATLSYSQSAPNSACSNVPGAEIWCGNWQVQLPQATTVEGVSGVLAVSDGTLANTSIEVSGNVPLIDGMFLTKLGARLTIIPPPTKITGMANISFGPSINGARLLTATGTLTRELPGNGTSGSYTASLTLNALKLTQTLGTATVTVPGDGSPTSIVLTLGPSASTGLSFSQSGVTVRVTGVLAGSFSATTFSITGNAQVTVNGTPLTGGSMKVNNYGMAACASVSTGKAGFEYVWSTGAATVLGTSGCSEQGF